jgi:NAD(P)-dependent dehydrogenase (short-subunit alcohol dehydrogenase family)
MNKIALVTGGSRGLGRDMALSLAKKGIDVIITYHTKMEEAGKVVDELHELGVKSLALPLDMSKIKSIDPFLFTFYEALKTYWHTDKFDFLINNAGIGATVPIEEVTEELFDSLLNIHFKGVYFLTKKAINHINDHGGVVFISSGTTRFCVPGYSVYSSMKSAIETFTKYVAKEYGKRGIRSNIVAPGPVETDFNNAAIRNNPQMKGYLSSQTALGRVGNADDIGSVVAFLCTDESKWVNGIRLEVSGGVML